MTKGYMEKPVPPSVPQKKELTKNEKIAYAAGAMLAVGSLVAFEALVVWVILSYLLKAKFAYLQVLGSALLFEYVLGRVRMKK